MILIEKIDNGFQLFTLGVCVILSLYRTFLTRSQIWALLGMFYGAITLGNLYWFLYMLLYDSVPHYSFIPDYCWISAFLFLFLLLIRVKRPEWEWKRGLISILIPVFTFGMCLFYMKWGDHLTNVFYAVFMTLIINYALQGLKTAERKTGRYAFYLHVLIYCATEYCLWTSSCISFVPEIAYYLFDVLLTIVYLFFYPVIRKVITDELH